MPLVFIHGVNTRDSGPGSKYSELVAGIERELRAHVLEPLGFAQMRFLSPYWGRFGVEFHWLTTDRQLAVVPKMGMLESNLLPASQPAHAGFGPAELDAVEDRAIAMACQEACEHEVTRRAIDDAPDEQSAAIALSQAVATLLPAASALGATNPQLESLLSIPAQVSERLLRVCTAVIANRRRQSLQRNASRFMGDAFVYARDRGTPASPGPIIQEVKRALRSHEAPPHEPLIVMTYSMGGNILYDILTSFDPSLEVAAWIAVGGQVSHFEDMKLFCSSDSKVTYPGRVAKPANVHSWINLYDRMDPLAFSAEPVFEGVKDVHYATGHSAFTAHGAYFQQPGFYHLVRSLLEPVLGRAGQR